MQVKLLLTLLFITIFTIIISSGCGGGSGTTQPSSLVTPTPNMTDNMAYITIKVKWPEQGMAGKLIMSSGNEEKEITASMPHDAKKIELKIFNYKGKDESLPIDFTNTDNILAEGRLPAPETQITIPIPVPTQVPTNPNILPAIPVKVWAGCFIDPNATDPNSALSTAEHYMVLKVGDQTANLKLGNYDLTLPPSLETTAGDIASLSATLQIKYPPSDPNNPASAPAPKPVAGKPIKFEIKTNGLTEGKGHFQGSEIDPNTIEATTYQDGNCPVNFIGDTAGYVTIEATFQANSNDPMETILL